MKDRIRKILLDEGLTSGGFADEIGVQRSSISHILNGRNNPSLDFIIKIVTRFPKLNTEWLLLGNGPMYKEDITDVNTTTGIAPTIFNGLLEADDLETNDKSVESPVYQANKAEIDFNQVAQILIFYHDSTFDVYKPRNLK